MKNFLLPSRNAERRDGIGYTHNLKQLGVMSPKRALHHKLAFLLGSFLCLVGFLFPISHAHSEKGSLLELNGYFRFRGDILHNMAMGVSPGVRGTDRTGAARKNFSWFPYFYPTSAYPKSDGIRSNSLTDDDIPKTLHSGNMRLRLRATFNVVEKIQLFTTIDFLDNLVLGSNPNPSDALNNDSQIPSGSGGASFMDSIRVRHAFASISTPLGKFRVGRMPNHWGLGIFANKGMRADSDHGDTVDRVLFITEIFGHLIIPSFDFISSGPNSIVSGQPFDLDPSDDTRQITLSLLKLDRGNKLRDKIEDGALVINYGAYLTYRWQNHTSLCPANNAACKQGTHPSGIALQKRGAWYFVPDLWFRLLWGEKLRLELELLFVIGNVDSNENQQEVSVLQWGGALELEGRFLEGSLQAGIKFGIASGDKDFSSRWGRAADTDKKLNAFRFDPEYRIDMILWREMYGGVTNAWYTKLHLTYNFQGDAWHAEEGIGFRIAGIYSMALNKDATLGQAKPLGLELNAHLRWATQDGYTFSVDYGVLFPLDGMSYAVMQGNERKEKLDAGVAQRVMFNVSVKF